MPCNADAEMKWRSAIYRETFLPFISHIFADSRLVTGLNRSSDKATAETLWLFSNGGRTLSRTPLVGSLAGGCCRRKTRKRFPAKTHNHSVPRFKRLTWMSSSFAPHRVAAAGEFSRLWSSGVPERTRWRAGLRTSLNGPGRNHGYHPQGFGLRSPGLQNHERLDRFRQPRRIAGW